MGALTPELREFLDANPVGVLATPLPTAVLGNRSSTSRATVTGC